MPVDVARYAHTGNESSRITRLGRRGRRSERVSPALVYPKNAEIKILTARPADFAGSSARSLVLCIPHAKESWTRSSAPRNRRNIRTPSPLPPTTTTTTRTSPLTRNSPPRESIDVYFLTLDRVYALPSNFRPTSVYDLLARFSPSGDPGVGFLPIPGIREEI